MRRGGAPEPSRARRCRRRVIHHGGGPAARRRSIDCADCLRDGHHTNLAADLDTGPTAAPDTRGTGHQVQRARRTGDRHVISGPWRLSLHQAGVQRDSRAAARDTATVRKLAVTVRVPRHPVT